MSLPNYRKNRILRLLALILLGMCFLPTLGNCQPANPTVVKTTESTNDANVKNSGSFPANEAWRDEVRLTAHDILSKVSSTYRDCKSYWDSGASKTEFLMDDGSKGVILTEFHTALRRRSELELRYRFTFRNSFYGHNYDKPTILWHDRQRTLICDEGQVDFKQEESLRLASARLTGISLGTSHMIPALLMPDLIKGRRIVDLSALLPPKLEKLEDEFCYRVEGLSGGEKTVLWIHHNSFLILKVLEHLTVEEEVGLRTTSYVPVLNEKIPVELLMKKVESEWKDE